MIYLASLIVGALFSSGIYLLLSRNLQRVALGLILILNGANVVVLAAAGLPRDARLPFVSEAPPTGDEADPLPHAFLLTAIVISMGMTAFLLAMAASMRRHTGSVVMPRDGAR